MTFTPSPYFGITLPSMRPDTQQCTGAQSSDLPFRIPIRFGESSISGCVLRYDWNTITTQCDAIRKAVFKYQMGELNTALTHVGRFGNSSYLATEDWIPILNQKVPESLTGNQVNRHQIHIEFLFRTGLGRLFILKLSKHNLILGRLQEASSVANPEHAQRSSPISASNSFTSPWDHSPTHNTQSLACDLTTCQDHSYTNVHQLIAPDRPTSRSHFPFARLFHSFGRMRGGMISYRYSLQ
jgi:hypothetical protein